MNFILQLHGDVRWLVVLAALLTIIKYAIGLLGKTSYQRIDRTLFSITMGLFDLNRARVDLAGWVGGRATG